MSNRGYLIEFNRVNHYLSSSKPSIRRIFVVLSTSLSKCIYVSALVFPICLRLHEMRNSAEGLVYAFETAQTFRSLYPGYQSLNYLVRNIARN